MLLLCTPCDVTLAEIFPCICGSGSDIGSARDAGRPTHVSHSNFTAIGTILPRTFWDTRWKWGWLHLNRYFLPLLFFIHSTIPIHTSQLITFLFCFSGDIMTECCQSRAIGFWADCKDADVDGFCAQVSTTRERLQRFLYTSHLRLNHISCPDLPVYDVLSATEQLWLHLRFPKPLHMFVHLLNSCGLRCVKVLTSWVDEEGDIISLPVTYPGFECARCKDYTTTIDEKGQCQKCHGIEKTPRSCS